MKSFLATLALAGVAAARHWTNTYYNYHTYDPWGTASSGSSSSSPSSGSSGSTDPAPATCTVNPNPTDYSGAVAPAGDCATRLAGGMQTTEANCEALYPFTLAMLDQGLNRLWEKYEVTTGDGYIITLARIRGNNVGTILPDDFGPVLLWHGEYGSGDDWMVTKTSTIAAMPTRLFDEGYDVWIAWKRGTYPSRGHTDPTFNADYNPTDPAASERYWNFTMDDIARDELPAVITKIH